MTCGNSSYGLGPGVKRGPACSICKTPALARGIDSDRRAARLVAQAWGVHASSVQRHRTHRAAESKRDDPAPPAPPKKPSSELDAREIILESLDKLRGSLDSVAAEDVPRIANAIASASKQLRDIMAGAEVTEAQVLKSPTWAKLQRTIAEALRPHPEAAKAVLEAIRREAA